MLREALAAEGALPAASQAGDPMLSVAAAYAAGIATRFINRRVSDASDWQDKVRGRCLGGAHFGFSGGREGGGRTR